MIKLIAADLDDTLLDENAKLSEENKRVIAQAMDQGVIFTLSTGRMFQSAAPFVRELGATDDLPIICYNGALIKRLSGETLHEETLAPELSSMIADYGQKHGWTVNAYFDDELYVSTMNQYVKDYQARIGVKARVVDDLVRFIQKEEKRLSKLLIIGEPEEVEGRSNELRSLVGSKVQIVRSRKKFIEVTSPKAHKGQALLWLGKFLGFSSSEIMAIGDSNNDISMLEMAGIGVAVGNASQGVKEAANVTTAPNYSNGVGQAIMKFVLSEKS